MHNEFQYYMLFEWANKFLYTCLILPVHMEKKKIPVK